MKKARNNGPTQIKGGCLSGKCIEQSFQCGLRTFMLFQHAEACTPLIFCGKRAENLAVAYRSFLISMFRPSMPAIKASNFRSGFELKYSYLGQIQFRLHLPQQRNAGAPTFQSLSPHKNASTKRIWALGSQNTASIPSHCASKKCGLKLLPEVPGLENQVEA